MPRFLRARALARELRRTRAPASLLPSPPARPCAAMGGHPRPGAGARHGATAWRAARQRQRTGIGSESAAPARSRSPTRQNRSGFGPFLSWRTSSVTRIREGREGREGRRPLLPVPPIPPILPNRPGCLRGDVDVDRPRLGFLSQRQPHREDAIFVLGRDPAGIDGRRQRERAAERAITPLDMVEVLVFRVARQLLLALDGEHAVFDCDVDVLTRHLGALSLQHELLIGNLVNIHRRLPAARRREPEIAKWVPTNNSHALLLFSIRRL